MYTGNHRPEGFTNVHDEGDRGSKVHDEEGRVEENELPNVLMTNDDGINAPGLQALVKALVKGKSCNVFISAPKSEKSAVAHSISTRETLEVSSVSISGATAFEVSGDGEMGGMQVVSGINKGSNYGYYIIYSGTVAGAREAYISGVPAISVSLDWKRGESSDKDFHAAAEVTLPLIYAALRDIKKGVFPQGCFLNVDIPLKPAQHKGYKVTTQGTSPLPLKWKQVTQEKRMQVVKEQGCGLQLGDLGRAAASIGAARRASGVKKSVDVESVGVGRGVPTTNQQKMHFRLEPWVQSKRLERLRMIMTLEHWSKDMQAHIKNIATLDELSLSGDLGDVGKQVTVTALRVATHLEAHTRSQAELWVAGVVEAAPPSAL